MQNISSQIVVFVLFLIYEGFFFGLCHAFMRAKRNNHYLRMKKWKGLAQVAFTPGVLIFIGGSCTMKNLLSTPELQDMDGYFIISWVVAILAVVYFPCFHKECRDILT